ncbi:NAD(P)/FAD-dependent oxidoreductase [Pelomonas sp. KK5]|uniref:NAD(P)/FAD-dependent oxidoreductase n=1 Tax=Pelomonas sp. KK5 TaxID=1855730 RepID=UPI00097C206C|nr:FAD-dependent oxidoreductase [Pelomonas sp. KK5]
MTSNKPIVIVGAGQAGARAALALRAQGWNGPVLLIGQEPHAPYERPALSKQALLDAATSLSWVAPVEDYAAQRIELRLGTRVLALDAQARSIELQAGDGPAERIGYDRLLLATGGSARRLAIPGSDDERVLYLRDAADARRLAARLRPGARLAVVGGGFIGLEVAASARQRGCEVTVLEAGTGVLGRAAPASLAALVQALHARHGVKLRLGDAPLAFEGLPDQVLVQLGSGGLLGVDAVLMGVGMMPNVALARAAGLRVNRGIVVDERLQASAPGIYAAGDVCEYPDADGAGTVLMESWANAEATGSHVAASMLGAVLPYRPVPWMWSDQYDHAFQRVGRCGAADRVVTREISGGRMEFYLGADGRLVGAAGFAPASSLARAFLVARKLVEARPCLPPTGLADPDVPLKSLLNR